MRNSTDTQPYKSPKHKLLAFFKQARDQWRDRANTYHQEKRALQVRLRDVEASRDHWRAKYFEVRPEPGVQGRHRGHEPPPTGAPARRSSSTVLSV